MPHTWVSVCLTHPIQSKHALSWKYMLEFPLTPDWVCSVPISHLAPRVSHQLGHRMDFASLKTWWTSPDHKDFHATHSFKVSIVLVCPILNSWFIGRSSQYVPAPQEHRNETEESTGRFIAFDDDGVSSGAAYLSPGLVSRTNISRATISVYLKEDKNIHFLHYFKE